MPRRLVRWAALALAFGLAISLATSTGGLSTSTMNRGFNARVVNDDHGYLGIDVQTNASNGETNATVAVTNRLPGAGSLDVRVDSGPTHRAVADVAPGETATLPLPNVTCGATLWVNATDEARAIHARRTVAC